VLVLTFEKIYSRKFVLEGKSREQYVAMEWCNSLSYKRRSHPSKADQFFVAKPFWKDLGKNRNQSLHTFKQHLYNLMIPPGFWISLIVCHRNFAHTKTQIEHDC
jgi:hypothetical protein